jgi:hypothetical protein
MDSSFLSTTSLFLCSYYLQTRDTFDKNRLTDILDSNQEIRNGERLRLYKIHGDVSDWQKVILTGESYSTFRDSYGFLYNQFDRSSGRTAWDILQTISFHVLGLPDFTILPQWLESVAQQIAGYDTQRNELFLNIHTTDKSAPENWSVTLDGRNVAQPVIPLDDHGFIQKLEQLEDMIHHPPALQFPRCPGRQRKEPGGGDLQIRHFHWKRLGRHTR